MNPMLAAVEADVATAFVEIGVLALALSLLARLASRVGVTAVPLFLLAGLAVGNGGVVDLAVSEEFVALGAEIGVLLLLLALGLEYTSDELRSGLRHGLTPGIADAALNFPPGLLAGLMLGWELPAAILLGGVTWISSSGVVSKVLTDLGRLGYRETPSILNLLVIEDLAMAVYLPVVAAIVVGSGAASTATTVVIALVVVGVVLWAAMEWGVHVSNRLARGNNESLLLAVFGLTLLVGGLAQRLEISAAIGAFLVGLAVSGPAQERASALIEPLRDLFAAIFFVFFAYRIAPADLVGVLLPAVALGVVTAGTKLWSGWVAAGRLGAGVPGRLRAGTVLVARGEFSIVIASLGATLTDGVELSTLAAAYVLITAVVGPLSTKHAARLAPRTLDRVPVSRRSSSTP